MNSEPLSPLERPLELPLEPPSPPLEWSRAAAGAIVGVASTTIGAATGATTAKAASPSTLSRVVSSPPQLFRWARPDDWREISPPAGSTPWAKGPGLYFDIGKKAKGQSPSPIDCLVSSVRAPPRRWDFSPGPVVLSNRLRNNKGDSLTASYYHIVNLVTKTAIDAEVNHSFSSNVNTITVGTQHALDPLTMLKARINNSSKAGALIQHEWRPRSFFTISEEVDTKSIDKSAKVGLALAHKP
ncbi:hypothetical protein NL676_033792 [Syzygium grande]|nr:hypothetical protein NL676_033792 [Syzygium grande]